MAPQRPGPTRARSRSGARVTPPQGTHPVDDLRVAEEWLSARNGVGLGDLVLAGNRPVRETSEAICSWLGWINGSRPPPSWVRGNLLSVPSRLGRDGGRGSGTARGRGRGDMAKEADFDAFVVARSPALLRTAYLLVGDEDLAEDLLQAALTKSWFAWNRITGEPEAYVRRVLVTTSA